MPVHDWTRVEDGIFHAFHVGWTVELAKALNRGILPSGYYALPEQIAGETHPDVLALHADLDLGSENGGQFANDGGGATLVLPSPAHVMTMAEPSYAQLSRIISIRHVSGDHVVALVELISHSNKSTLESLGMLVNKTCNALRRGMHVLLVDLYPPGTRDPQGIHAVIWESMGGELPSTFPERPLTAVSYEALGSASDAQQLKAYVKPLDVGDLIPEMPLFLRPGQFVNAPLEATYQAAFDSLPQRWKSVVSGPKSEFHSRG